jgi:putative ABC transport system permease protein
VAGRKVYRLPWRTARQIRADVDTELAFHIDMRVDALVALGNEPAAARAQALTEFGDVDDARRYIGAVDGATEAASRRRDLMGDLRQDLVYALRKMRSAPGFAAAVIAILALGIGATTAIFSVVNGVLLEPLPFPRAERIVRLYQVTDKGTRNSVSQPNYNDWAAGSRSFAALALLWGPGGTFTVTGLPEPVIAHGSAVTRDFFSVFGVQPEIGRLFNAEETTFGGPRTVVVSDGFWRERIGARRRGWGYRPPLEA